MLAINAENRHKFACKFPKLPNRFSVELIRKLASRNESMEHTQRNQKILDAIARQTERGTASKHAAREMLISEGIYTKKGKLKVEFGGDGKGKAAA
ncbi:hypothetical protein [Sphingomonas sp. 35-24ZXX]|uniref:hypothetical protein n=1 Tax=Sphingomonas sp. 35-24ZXX TaxID=1545915 RepID=UPI0018CD30C7|nr:hypothetical protein [Sphingomonas sp. 35-24ZXX]